MIAIMDLSPTSKGHSLIIPKEHYTNIYDIDEEIAGKVMKTAKKLATKMTVALNCDGFNLLQNNGECRPPSHPFSIPFISLSPC